MTIESYQKIQLDASGNNIKPKLDASGNKIYQSCGLVEHLQAQVGQGSEPEVRY